MCQPILTISDRFDDDDEEDDFEKCKLEYERLTEVDKSQLTLNEYVDKHHWKFSGKLKPPHYHIVLRTERNMAYETIAGWLGVPDQCIEGARNRRGDKSGDVTFADLIRYLTHEGQEKHRYHDSDVTANFNWRKMLDDIDLKLAKYGNKSVKDYYRHKVTYNGMSIHQVIKENEDAYIADMLFLDKCRAKYLTEFAALPSCRINVYLDGKGGIGKNVASKALAHSLFPNLDTEDLYFEVGGANTSFDGYDGQPIIIWNDFRSVDLITRFGRGELYDILDMHPTNARHNIKYGSVRLTNPINIINGIESYRKFLDSLAGEYTDKSGNIRKSEDKSQTYRRLPCIMCLRENEYDLLFNKGVFENTRDYQQYTGYYGITGSFAKVAQKLTGEARRQIELKMCAPLVEKIRELQSNDSKKIMKVEHIPDEFQKFGDIVPVEKKSELQFTNPYPEFIWPD